VASAAGTSQGVHRAVVLIRAVANAGAHGIALSELARATGLHKATTHRIVGSLCNEGLLERDAHTGRFRLCMELFVLGSHAFERLGLRSIAQASMDRLCETFEDTAFLSIR